MLQLALEEIEDIFTRASYGFDHYWKGRQGEVYIVTNGNVNEVVGMTFSPSIRTAHETVRVWRLKSIFKGDV